MNGRISVETTFLTFFLFWDGGDEAGSGFFAVVALHGLFDSVGGGEGDSIGLFSFLIFLWMRGTSSSSSAAANFSSSASFSSASSLSFLSRDLVTWSTAAADFSKLRGSRTSSTLRDFVELSTCGASGVNFSNMAHRTSSREQIRGKLGT